MIQLQLTNSAHPLNIYLQILVSSTQKLQQTPDMMHFNPVKWEKTHNTSTLIIPTKIYSGVRTYPLTAEIAFYS